MRTSGFNPDDNICWQFCNPGDDRFCKCPACSTTQYRASQSVFFGRSGCSGSWASAGEQSSRKIRTIRTTTDSPRSGQRWFWTAHSWAGDNNKQVDGITETEPEAVEVATAAVRSFYDGRPIRATFSAGVASDRLRELNKEKRAARPPSNAKGAPVVEYLYLGWHTRHQIVKRTKQRVYYLKKGERIDEHGEPNEPSNIRDYTNEGEIGFKTYKYLEADARRYPRYYFTSLEDLFADRDHQRRLWPGRERPDDLTALKEAMAAAHPDRGGSSADFIAARAAYVAARRLQRETAS